MIAFVVRQGKAEGEEGGCSLADEDAPPVGASAWLRLHHPAALVAGMMAHQPMGFYDTQILIGDATGRGITVHGPDVQTSGVHATLEHDAKLGARHTSDRGRPRLAGAR
ncbi:hypothetical protein [Streptomyces anulatus]|uniref:hypothetical protein n=1 Tax=Streptomyces anulatus TaxID=1892 RepID=UPI00368B1F07